MFDIGAYQQSQYKAPESDRNVSFGFEAIRQPDGSYKNVEYVTIFLSKNEVVHRKVTEEDKIRFPVKYNAFKEGSTPPESGIPLSEWAVATRADVENAKGLRIFTVEQLAETPDTRLQKRHLISLKYKAIDFLESNKDAGVLSQLRDEIEKLREQVKVLEGQKIEMIRAHRESGSADK